MFLRWLCVLLLDALRNVRQTLLDLLPHLLNGLFTSIRQSSVILQRVCAAAIDLDELFLPKDLLFWDQPGTSSKITLCHFVVTGRISCYSLITSFIAIPAATLILYLCVLLFILSPLTYISFLASPTEGLMQLVINVLTSITQFINTAFRLTSMLPGASIEHVHLSLLQLAILYVAILAGYFAFVKWYRLKEKMV